MKKKIVKGKCSMPSKKESWEVLNDSIVELTKEIKNFARGLSVWSLYFKRGYENNPNAKLEGKFTDEAH